MLFKHVQGPLSAICQDQDELDDLIESMNDGELRIILQNVHDPKLLMQIKTRVQQDIDSTAKDLAIDG